MNRGKFIVFEGIDGSGKTTMLNKLGTYLSEKNEIYLTAEPSSGPMGALLRQVLSGRIQADSSAAAALFASDRLDHITNPMNGLLSKIKSGVTVLSDRYYLSSYAYQGVDNPIDWVIAINSRAARLLKPDINIFIDVSPETAMERITKNRGDVEIYENIKRLSATRAQFLDVIDRVSDSENIVIIDGNRSVEQVWDDVRNAALTLFDERN